MNWPRRPALVAPVRVWRVCPFDLSNFAFDWALFVRSPPLVAIVGSVVGLIVNVIALLKISLNLR